MKIAIDIRNIGRQKTGSEVVVRELVKHLLAIDQANEYILLTDTDDGDVLAQVREKLALDGKENVSIVSLTARNKFVWAAWSVWRWVRAQKPDVYHTEYIVPFFLSRSVRVITHIHDVSFAAMPQYIGARDLFFLRLLIPWSLRRADKIIAVSRFTKDEIVRYYRVTREKITLVYNAVSQSFLTQASQQQVSVARKKYDLPERYIFSLGTMQPRKNIPFLVEAFAQASERLPGISLVLSGKRAHHFDEAIETTVARYPHIMERIVFTGFIDDSDLPAVYAGATAFVFPSLYEGFGLPLLEAMSQGVPVLANDAPVFREVAGECAYFADARDLDSFAEALYTVTMCNVSARRERIHCGRNRARMFSWHNAAREMCALFVHKV